VSLSRRGELHEDAGWDVVRGDTNMYLQGGDWGGVRRGVETLPEIERAIGTSLKPWLCTQPTDCIRTHTHTHTHAALRSGPVFLLAVKRGGASDGFSSVTNQPGSRHHQFSLSLSLSFLYLIFYPSPSISLSLDIYSILSAATHPETGLYYPAASWISSSSRSLFVR
jgi:hypothetical protein